MNNIKQLAIMTTIICVIRSQNLRKKQDKMYFYSCYDLLKISLNKAGHNRIFQYVYEIIKKHYAH